MAWSRGIHDDPALGVEPSGVRLGIAPSAGEFLEELRAGVESSGGDGRLVSVVCDHLPTMGLLIDGMLAHLAEVAFVLWPDWYGGILPSAAIEPSRLPFEDRLAVALGRAGSLRRPVSMSWLTAACMLCRAGRIPLVGGSPRAVGAAQLALAIGPADLIVALAVGDAQPSRGRLLGLARAAEWLGRATGARILVVVPEALAGSSELDGINFDPLVARPEPACPPDSLTPGRSVGVWPVLGRPHPLSPGEQLLAARLTSDEMLGGLFRSNIRVRSRLDGDFLVDLLWPEGRVVVEVDGYGHHSSRAAFSRDRRRDYELVVSGYLVLRLPHDEVIEDVEIAVEKIRDLVLFRRSERDQRR